MHMPKNDSMDMGMMKMYFHLGYHEKNIIFKGWNVDSIGGLIGTMVAFVVLGFLYEGLKAFREHLRIREINERKQRLPLNHNKEKYYGEVQPLVGNVLFRKPPLCGGIRVIQALLHVLQMFMGYVLMLAFMAYNTWICLAILLGGGIGHLIFTWLVDPPLSDSADHCM